MLAGEFVGPYEIRGRIGVGGMGVVYEAITPSGASVAIKVLHRDQLGNAAALRRFHDEAIAGLVVTHPNVASTYASGETEDGVPFLVMERVRGQMLGAWIHAPTAPSLRRCAAIVRQLLGGLQAMHAAGVVHGDVKTDNVVVETRADGTQVAKLIDLGLAHVCFDRAARDTDAPIGGTPEYLAPEVIRGRGSSPASDLYAVGIILYELVTGNTPFTGERVEDILVGQLRDPPVPPSVRRPSTPEILERIIMHALAKEPAHRFASAAAFASALAVALPVLDDSEEQRRSVAPRERQTREWISGGRRRIARGTPNVR